MNKKAKILVVDDEELIREILVEELQLAGYETVEAENGLIAKDIFKTQEFDLILSDIKMPGGNGIDFLKFIRSQANSLIPFILISGYSDYTVRDCFGYGADGIFAKPFDLETLIEQVKFFLKHPKDRYIDEKFSIDSQFSLLSHEQAFFEFSRGGFLLSSSQSLTLGQKYYYEKDGKMALVVCKWIDSKMNLAGFEWVRMNPSFYEWCQESETKILETRVKIPVSLDKCLI